MDDFVFRANADFDDMSADDMVFSSANVDFENADTSQGISVDETVFTTSNVDFVDNDANGGVSVDDMVFTSIYNKDFED